MRTFNVRFASATFIAALVLTGCTSFSATIVNPDASVGTSGGSSAGGESSTGGNPESESSTGGATLTGGFTSVGGVSSIAGGSRSTSATAGGSQVTSTSLGGSSSTGGVAASGGIGATVTGSAALSGGAPSSGGAVSVGGAPSSGGTSPTAGTTSTGVLTTGGAVATGGASACAKDADCANPDPINCSYTCVNPGATGTCKPSLLTTPTRCATDDCAERAISGFWSDGKPYIAYGFTESDGSGSIRMQALQSDGSTDGDAAVYSMPAEQREPFLISANGRDGDVGLLFASTIPVSLAESNGNVFFTATDQTGAKNSTPIQLESDSMNTPIKPAALALAVTGSGAWLGLELQSASATTTWEVASGSTLGAWSMSPELYDGGFAGSVIGDTVMLTGSSCIGYSGCQRSVQLRRYQAATLMEIGTSIVLSQNFAAVRSPAMGPVNGSMALFWTETESPGQLFRAAIREDGTFAVSIGTAQSAVVPKAVLQSADGGALLVGTIVSAGASGAVYQVIAQRLDANLNPIGNALPVADKQSEDANTFETRLSSDGKQVLVTYSQVGARYRLLATDLCE